MSLMGETPREGIENVLTEMKPYDFLHVDEGQRLVTLAQALLMQVIDDNVKPVTILISTDQPGRLANALLKRLQLQVPIGYYSLSELKEIVEVQAKKLDILLSPQAAGLVARVSCGLPRNAEHLLGPLRRRFHASKDQQLTMEDVRTFLRESGIAENGLNSWQQSYLRYLADVGVAAVESLALHLGVDVDYVRSQIEPPLLREKLIKITPRGRQTTELGNRWIAETNGSLGKEETNG